MDGVGATPAPYAAPGTWMAMLFFYIKMVQSHENSSPKEFFIVSIASFTVKPISLQSDNEISSPEQLRSREI